MPARVIEGAFKPATELAAFEAMQVAGSVGATASFIGTMRNHNEGDAVAHRAAAFDACRYLMEELKSRAPFWKKEALADGGSRWVEKNTPG